MGSSRNSHNGDRSKCVSENDVQPPSVENPRRAASPSVVHLLHLSHRTRFPVAAWFVFNFSSARIGDGCGGAIQIEGVADLLGYGISVDYNGALLLRNVPHAVELPRGRACCITHTGAA